MWDEMDGGVDDAGAMLDDGKLSPRDITPICTIRWLTGGNVISKKKHEIYSAMTTDLSSRSRLVCVCDTE